MSKWRLQQQQPQQRLETRHVSSRWYVYDYYYCYTNVYFKLIYLRMTAWDKRARDATRLEFSGKLFFSLFFNYTKEYLKVICLRMEMSGAAGKGEGGWDKRGLEMRRVLSPRYVFSQLFIITECAQKGPNDVNCRYHANEIAF